MLRSRIISPGIATNETLAQLGPQAILLFERLWMLADREGRLENRPARIRAEAFPYWPDFPVEDLVEKLRKSGFITCYNSPKLPLIAINTFKTHQNVHPHEAKSVLPPPPKTSGRPRKNGSYKSDARVPNVITCHDMSRNVRVPLPLLTSPQSSSEQSHTPGPPTTTTNPEEKPTQKPTPPAPRKQPAREQQASQKTHSEEDVILIRDSLHGLASQIGMPPPDDGIVLQVLNQGHGAGGHQLHAVLVDLWNRNKFRAMRSWGLVPLLVGQCVNAPSQLKLG